MENLTEKRERLIKYIVTNPREVAQLTEILKQKVQAKAQKIRRHEKKEPSLSKIRCLKMTPKYFTETWAQEI